MVLFSEKKLKNDYLQLSHHPRNGFRHSTERKARESSQTRCYGTCEQLLPLLFSLLTIRHVLRSFESEENASGMLGVM